MLGTARLALGKMAESASPAAASERRQTVRYLSQQQSDRRRAKTRVNIGEAYARWTHVKDLYGIKTHAEMATFLLDRYDITCLDPSTSTPSKRRKRRRPNPPALSSIAGSLSQLRYEKHSKRPCLSVHTNVVRNVQPPLPPVLSSIGTESQSDSMHYESPLSSLNEDKHETCASPFVCASENGKAPGKKDAPPQRAGDQDRQLIIKQSQNKVNRDIEEDEDEEFSTTLSVGDGRYLVDLGSSSEFIVDEECILQLFKLCRECNKQCSVRKRVQGLKIVVHQTCCFCQSRFTWTNLPDADEDDGLQVEGDFQINGQTDTAASPSSNTS